MKRCLFMVLCKVSAQPGASGPHLVTVHLSILRRQRASNDVSFSKNSSFGILDLLWLHYCAQVSLFHLVYSSRTDIYRLPFMLLNPRHSRTKYCTSVKTIGMYSVRLLSSDLPVSHSLSWKRYASSTFTYQFFMQASYCRAKRKRCFVSVN